MKINCFMKKLICGIAAAAILTVVSIPCFAAEDTPLDRTGWTGKFTVLMHTDDWSWADVYPYDCNQIVDGSATTGYTSNRAQTSFDYFSVLFGKEEDVQRISFTTLKAGEYPGEIKIQYSEDNGSTWLDTFGMVTYGDTTEIEFAEPITATGFLFQLAKDDPKKNWSIAEINAYDTVSASAAATSSSESSESVASDKKESSEEDTADTSSESKKTDDDQQDAAQTTVASEHKGWLIGLTVACGVELLAILGLGAVIMLHIHDSKKQ